MKETITPKVFNRLFLLTTRLAAILTCGLMLTACVDNIDNPSGGVEPVVPATNIEEESEFEDKMDLATYCGDDFYQYALGTWLKENPVPTEDGDKSVGTGDDQENNVNFALQFIIKIKKDPLNPVANDLLMAYNPDDFKADSTRVMKKIEEVDQVSTKENMLKLMARLISEGYACPLAIRPTNMQRKVYPRLMAQTQFVLEAENLVRMGFSTIDADTIIAAGKMWENTLKNDDEKEANRRIGRCNPHAGLILVNRAGTRGESGSDFIDMIAQATGIDLSTIAADKDYLEVADGIAKLDLEYLKNLTKYVIMNRDFKYLPVEKLEDNVSYVLLAAKDDFSGLSTSLSHSFAQNSVPDAAKAEATEMVNQLRATFRERINRSDWLSDATKAKACEKLDAMVLYCGWPDNFHEEWEATIAQGTTAYEKICDLYKQYVGIAKKLMGQTSEDAMHYTEWMASGAYISNAFYSVYNNAMVILASNLMEPMYDKDQSAFINYSHLGHTVGHEMTHGFDNDGAKYNAVGVLEDWWQPADMERYKQKQQLMIAHFDKIGQMPGVFCNGTQTLGENIADLGGLEIAYETYMKTVSETGAERDRLGREFFRGYAVAWMINATAEDLEPYKTNEHAIPKVRVNGNVCLTNEWYRLFNINSGVLYLKPEQRITIW